MFPGTVRLPSAGTLEKKYAPQTPEGSGIRCLWEALQKKAHGVSAGCSPVSAAWRNGLPLSQHGKEVRKIVGRLSIKL